MNILAFPGQGSQKIGMGKIFYENFDTAKSVFEEVDNTLNFKLSKLIFDGDISELSLTSNTQPALMAVSIAILRVFLEENKVNINEKFKFVCGHSLGEFTALCAANVLSLKDTANLLKINYCKIYINYYIAIKLLAVIKHNGFTNWYIHRENLCLYMKV